MDIQTIPGDFILSILSAAESKGLERQQLLDAAEIPAGILTSEKSRVPANNFRRLTLIISNQLNDEALGFIERPVKTGTFALYSRTCIHCPTLEKLLQRTIEFNRIVFDHFGYTLKVEGDFVHLEYFTDAGFNDPNNYMTLSLMALSHRVFSWFIGQRITLESTKFKHHRPLHADDYNYLFSCPVEFNCTGNSLVFHKSYLNKVIAQNEASLEAMLQHEAIDLLNLPHNENSLVTKVHQAITNLHYDQFPELEEISKQLLLTSTTLRRRLKSEGSSYQQIKDDIRRDQAIYLLSRGQLSLEEIATKVGFSEPTSFFRAFKRWTGVTPRAYLKEAQEESTPLGNRL